jgi:hypothetical protein
MGEKSARRAFARGPPTGGTPKNALPCSNKQYVVYFKMSLVYVLRTKAGMCVAFSTDIISLRETVARGAFTKTTICNAPLYIY